MLDDAGKSKALEFFGNFDCLTHEILSNLKGMGWGKFYDRIVGPPFLDVKNSCEAEYVSPISNFEFFAL